MAALAKFEARSAELIDVLDTLSALDWAAKFAAPHVMAAPITGPERSEFQKALQLRGNSKTPAFNGLFVMCITNFELFVKEETDEALARKAGKVGAFSKLDKTFQDNYISHFGRVVSGKSAGTVGGVPFSRFDDVVKSFSRGYVEDGALKLMGEIFTLLMGNPTWEKLDKLLVTLGVADSLNKEFASVAAMKSQFGNAKWTEVLKGSESFHEGALRRRNSIVHNIIPISLGDEDVRDAVQFYGAFATALDELITMHV